MRENEKKFLNFVNDGVYKVYKIRSKLKKGISQTKIAKEYNVTEENIGYINRRVTWKYV